MTHESAAHEDLPDPGPLVALSFLAPWAFVAALLPDPWRMRAAGLVAVLALLLLSAAAWSFRRAAQRGIDPSRWACLAVLTLGFSMLGLLAKRPSAGAPMTFVCTECGHHARLEEPFCFRCGAS